MGMAAILFNSAEPFEQIVNTLSTEGPTWNLVKIAQAVSEKKTFKNHTILYMCIAQGQGQITPMGLKSYIVSFSHYSFIYFEKMNFQHFPHINVQGRKFNLAVKKAEGQPTVIIWINLVDVESLML